LTSKDFHVEIFDLVEARFLLLLIQNSPVTVVNGVATALCYRKKEQGYVIRPGPCSVVQQQIRRQFETLCYDTRSDTGRQCSDTFSSLKKTCRKLGAVNI
jgi:hypothetical protein